VNVSAPRDADRLVAFRGLLGLAAIAVLTAGAARARATDPGTSADSARVASHADSVAWADSIPPPSDPRPEGRLLNGRPIGRIEIVNYDIFEPVPTGRLGPVYRTVNRLHVTTRSLTVREQLLFEEDEPWNEARGRETERNLRNLGYIIPERIVAQPTGDSVAVRVVTHDTWSTKFDIGIESAESRSYGTVGISERNLGGFGKSVSFYYRESPDGISRSFAFDDPNLFWTRGQLHYLASKGSAGAADRLSVGVPFYAQHTRHAFGVSWNRSTAVGRLYQDAEEVARFDQRFEGAEVFYGRGWRRNGTVWRAIGSLQSLDRRLGPSIVEAAAPPEFLGGEENLRLRRVVVQGRWWRPQFVERTNVDRLGVIEDFDLSEQLSLSLGMAPEWLGSWTDEGYVGIGVEMGREGAGMGWVRAAGASRIVQGLSEASAQLDARWIHHPSRRNTLVAAAMGRAGRDVSRDYQIVIGGLTGLRGYPVEAVTGQRACRLNLEHRSVVLENMWDLLTVGVVAFTDAGRAWGPGSGGAGWFHSAGTGIRVGLPRWSPNQVLRMDVAWPLDPARDGRHQPTISFGSGQAF
jgi:hypothetical protein